MTTDEISKYQVIGIFVFGALVLGTTILSSKFKKVNVDGKTIFKFYRKSNEVNLFRCSFLFLFFILIFELYVKQELFTSLFLIVILYDLYLSIRFAKFEANKKLLYHKDYGIYEYYANDTITIFSSKDIKSIQISRPLHPLGKFRIADIELDNTILRITEHLFDFDKVGLLEGKNVSVRKPSLKFELGPE